ILSRCRMISFQPLGEGHVKALLMREKGMPEAAAGLVARMTGGRVGQALDADPEDISAKRNDFLRILEAITGKGASAVLGEAEKAAKDESRLEDFIFFGTMWFRDILILSVGGDPGLAYNEDIVGLLWEWAGRLSPYRCEEALMLLRQAGQSLDRTFNRRFLAEELFFRFKEEVLA
ncbi:MAG: hypothetical protein ABSG42_03440, partial [Nitrospirota bacterium]